MADYLLLQQIREHLAIDLPALANTEMPSHMMARAELEDYIKHIEKISELNQIQNEQTCETLNTTSYPRAGQNTMDNPKR